MAGRIRSIKPEVLDDELAARLSDEAWRLWVSTWVLADDHGNIRAGDRYLAASVWQDTSRDVSRPLKELVDAGFLSAYAVRGQRYAHINGWENGQRVDNAGKPRVPVPSEDDGTWNQQLSGLFAYSRGNPPQSSATQQKLPLAQSGGETTITTTITTTDLEGAATRPIRSRKAKVQVPQDFRPTPEIVSWAAGQGDGVDALALVEEFVEHWRSVGEVRADWQLTFKKRVRWLVDNGKPYPRLPEAEAAPPTPAPGALVGDAAKPHIERLKSFLSGGAQRPEGT
jgi:hypothetical protein